jgi:serine/threonine-protein kinase HipA
MPEAIAGVFLGDRRVGTLGYRDGNTRFDYEDLEPIHPVLGQGFERNPRLRRNASGGVPEWFSNLLPEQGSGLRDLIGRELGKKNPHDFQLITYIGEDLPGAVRVILESKIANIPALTEHADKAADHRVRFSLAGVQAKFSMRWEGKGLVLPMSGMGGNWIVKLPDRRFPQVPQNEFAMLAWSRLTGIDVPRIELFRGDQLLGLPNGLIAYDELAFGIQRFDRDRGRRIHQEDFAQVREVSVDSKYDNSSYSGLARIIKATCEEDIDEYVRRLVAIVIMGNIDAHLKNWTIRYPDGRTARLSPAYDFMSISAYSEFDHGTLAFAVNGARLAEAVTFENFRSMARQSELDEDRVLQVVAQSSLLFLETWPQVKVDCSVPDFVVTHIEKRLRNLPLLQEVRRGARRSS